MRGVDSTQPAGRSTLCPPVEPEVSIREIGLRPRPSSGSWRLVLDVAELCKLRVNALVVFTAFTGFVLARGGVSAWNGAIPAVLLHGLAATFLVASGSSTLNQLLEWRHDRCMGRTWSRPIPADRISRRSAGLFGAVLVTAGTLWLAFGVNLVCAAVGVATFVVYLALYTPLKRRTTLSLLVGAVAGAAPPLIGWAAARGELSGPAWSLFAIIYLWQVPHFLSIAWLYREDYRRAGFVLLTVVDPSGKATALQSVTYSFALLPASLLPLVGGLVDHSYLLPALVLGAGLISVAFVFALHRNRWSARLLLLGSLVYLSLLFAVLLVTS